MSQDLLTALLQNVFPTQSMSMSFHGFNDLQNAFHVIFVRKHRIWATVILPGRGRRIFYFYGASDIQSTACTFNFGARLHVRNIITREQSELTKFVYSAHGRVLRF